MVRICKGLYINPLTVAFFVICYLSGKTAFFMLSYISMLLHELAHLAAACFIGLKPSHISLHPFGVNLKLKSTIVCGILEDIILYLSGPCLNLVLAFLFISVFKGRYLYDYGFAVNIMLFAVNMLPICPLDGGNITKKILCNYMGEGFAAGVMKMISGILSFLVLIFGIYIAVKTGYNYSCIFISVLIFTNIFTAQEKYSETAIKNLIYQKRVQKSKVGKAVRMYVSDKNFTPGKYLKYIRPGTFTCVAIVGENGEIEKLISENEILSYVYKK